MIYELYPPKNVDQLSKFMECVHELDEGSVSIAIGEGREHLSAMTGAFTAGSWPTIQHIAVAGRTKETVGALFQVAFDSAASVLIVRGVEESIEGEYDVLEAIDMAASYVDRVVVAAYPEAPIKDAVARLARKFDCGASEAFCMFSFDNDGFDRFADKVWGSSANIPLRPGVIPIHPALPYLAAQFGVKLPEAVRALVGAGEGAALDCLADQVADLQRRGFEPYVYTINRPDVIRRLGG